MVSLGIGVLFFFFLCFFLFFFCCCFFFFNDTATTEIYTLSLHDALPIWACFRGHAMRKPRFVYFGLCDGNKIRDLQGPQIRGKEMFGQNRFSLTTAVTSNSLDQHVCLS